MEQRDYGIAHEPGVVLCIKTLVKWLKLEIQM